MPALIPLCLLWIIVGTCLSAIDIRQHRLPNRIVLPMYPVLVLALGLTGMLSGNWPLVRTLMCATMWLAVIGLVWLVSGGKAMGFGDVKLAPLLGATLGWVSWDAAILGLMSCWLIAGLWALALLVSRRVSLGSAIAFGPFMFLGLAIGIALGGGLATGA